jgi:hypothetical protein
MPCFAYVYAVAPSPGLSRSYTATVGGYKGDALPSRCFGPLFLELIPAVRGMPHCGSRLLPVCKKHFSPVLDIVLRSTGFSLSGGSHQLHHVTSEAMLTV